MNFDFAILDDLLEVSPERMITALQHVGLVEAGDLGPFVEYAYLRWQSQFLHLPQVGALTKAALAIAVEECVSHATKPLHDSSLTPNSAEVVPLPPTITDNAYWTAFLWRLVNAAKQAGFGDLFAKGFAGAFGELADNVFQHSQQADTAMGAYRWAPGLFEMVIADAGIGIGASLRQNPEFSSLTDDDKALAAATTMGASRFGSSNGHGTGFKTVFDAIAGSGFIRFRSGTAALILNQTGSQVIQRRSLQRRHFGGMFASILCRVT